MKVVIDTNVAIAANGRNTHACNKCQLECVEYLENLTAAVGRRKIYLDDLDLLLSEYKPHLNFHGQPGIGDAFYKFLHDHKYSGKKVVLVSITRNDDSETGFNELPVNSIDPSDRKILAISVVASAQIVNALDNDWHEKRDFLEGLGIEVVQLCPEHGCVK
jgi:predicted nucleic acid-binding protein